MNERDVAIDLVYDAIRARSTISAEAFRRELAAWEVFPVRVDAEIVGAVLRKGAELHLGVTRTPSSSSRRFVREILMKTIEQHGAAVTSVDATNPTGLRFCERLGFKEYCRIGGVVHLQCERPTHA